MILINNNFEFKVEGVKTDKNGNYILLDITISREKNYISKYIALMKIIQISIPI